MLWWTSPVTGGKVFIAVIQRWLQGHTLFLLQRIMKLVCIFLAYKLLKHCFHCQNCLHNFSLGRLEATSPGRSNKWKLIILKTLVFQSKVVLAGEACKVFLQLHVRIRLLNKELLEASPASSWCLLALLLQHQTAWYTAGRQESHMGWEHLDERVRGARALSAIWACISGV